MSVKCLAAAAAISMLAAGAAHAGDYGGTPPYESAAYGYAGYDSGCGGFTLAGVRAGVTVLGVNLGAGVRASLGGGCGRHIDGGGAVYASPAPVYQQGYPGPGYGGGFGQAYPSPAAFPAPGYAQPGYPQPGYGYAPQPCGCQGQGYGYPQPY